MNMTLLLFAVVLIGGWFIASRKDEATNLPRVWTTRLGIGMILVVWPLGVLAWPDSLTWPLAAWWVLGLVLLRSASQNALGWVSAGEVVAEAVRVGWVTPLRSLFSALALAGGLAFHVFSGFPHSAILGTGIALMPAAWWLRSAWIRQAEQQRAEQRMAGTWTKGRGWDALAADRGAAPVKVAAFDLADQPRLLTAPIPADWDSAKQESVELDIQNRLCRTIGERWPVTFDYGRRRITTRCVPPLPISLPLTPAMEPPEQHKIMAGYMSISRRAAQGGVGPYAHQTNLHLDFSVSPHWLVVGETGSGKSICLTSVVTQLARKGWSVYFIDPKRVEATAFAGRRNIVKIGVALDEWIEVAQEVESEMQRRYDLLRETGLRERRKVTKIAHLSAEQQAALLPILLVVDEIVELLAKLPGTSDEAKEINEKKAQIMLLMDSIVRLGRAADVHLIAACQRADRSIVTGQFQNNLSTVMLCNPAGANSTTRTMADLNEVDVSVATPGRAVVRSIGLPECEVQGVYVDDDELDDWLEWEHEMPLSDPTPEALVEVMSDVPLTEGAAADLREQPGDIDLSDLSDEDLLGM